MRATKTTLTDPYKEEYRQDIFFCYTKKKLFFPPTIQLLFLLHFNAIPSRLSLHLFPWPLLSAKKIQLLHPFSNVENVVQMFLIVIIKAKSGYVM